MLSPKEPELKRARGMGQVIEHLPDKYETPNFF
jgi:hypothetical protein